jgi:hypothetical protein
MEWISPSEREVYAASTNTGRAIGKYLQLAQIHGSRLGSRNPAKKTKSHQAPWRGPSSIEIASGFKSSTRTQDLRWTLKQSNGFFEGKISMSNDEREMPPEKAELVNRRSFLEVAAGAAVVVAVPEIAAAQNSRPDRGGGPLYMQTNEIQNAIIHYRRDARGALTEVERVPTGGAGSGTFKPISGQESAPNAFEGAGSVILSPDRQLLFTTNGGDNSVSSFRIGKDGRLTRRDVKPTGNRVKERSGTAKSLAYAPSKGILFVVHSFGPDHVRLMSVDAEGTLNTRPERYTANTPEKTDRVPTMGVLSPNGKFLLVGTTFDQPIAHTGLYPNGLRTSATATSAATTSTAAA